MLKHTNRILRSIKGLGLFDEVVELLDILFTEP